MYFLIVVSYSPDDGEMLFKSDSSWDDTITETISIVRYQNSDLEIEEAASGALSISVPAFLENFDSIIEILSYLDPGSLEIKESAAAMLEWARSILDTDDTFQALDESSIETSEFDRLEFRQ